MSRVRGMISTAEYWASYMTFVAQNTISTSCLEFCRVFRINGLCVEAYLVGP